MILTAHQPVYLPWAGLFHKIAKADVFCYFDIVQYQPKDWNNRNRIKNNIWLTVPVKRKGYLEKTINEIEIDNKQPWRRKHLKSIYYNYHKEPYFAKYYENLEWFYNQEYKYLSELNYAMLVWMLYELGLQTVVEVASNYDFKGKKSNLVLDMCKKLGADKYIFGEQGVNYADVESFRNSGIDVEFQNYNGQNKLSVIDLMFRYGEDTMEIINASD